MKKIIIPSIIAKNQNELTKRINRIKRYAKFIQLDFMDGKFVANKSLLFDFKIPKFKKYEAHLMMENPEKWIKMNYKKFHTIIFHVESFKTSSRIVGIIKLIKSRKRKVGMAINLETPLSKIKPYLDNLDLVLVMAVKPGKYGARFIKYSLRRIQNIKKNYPKLEIEVDGGINKKTIIQTNKVGANRFVVGSFLQKSKNVKRNIKILKSSINNKFNKQ